ncbi:MAG: monomethylamine:corrinoid methyltransferase [Thermodesulfobacteriota bacterium]
MISFSEVVKRAVSGPICTEKEFDMEILVPELRRVVKKYEIKYDPKNPIPSDDGLADRIWAAAVEFYTRVGSYCTSSERRIIFTPEEIQDALITANEGVWLGEGNERSLLKWRKPESTERPFLSLGAAGAPVTTEDILARVALGFAKIPFSNGMTTPGLTFIDGQRTMSGSPLEMEAAIRNVKLVREACRRAGRPGLPIMNGLATAGTAAATIGASHFGMRTSDIWELGAIAEMKVNFELLNKATYLQAWGGNSLGETGPVLGGWFGGPEGLAVGLTAYHLHTLLVHRSVFQHPFSTHFKYGCNTGRDLIWVFALNSQACSRNSHWPVLSLVYTAGGPMTEMYFQEATAWTLACITGGTVVEVGGVAKAINPDHLTPLEPMFAGEVALAAAEAGMTRRQANEIALDLLPKYEAKIKGDPNLTIGRKYQELYNMDTHEPCSEYVDLYRQMKKEMSQYGIKFKYDFPTR